MFFKTHCKHHFLMLASSSSKGLNVIIWTFSIIGPRNFFLFLFSFLLWWMLQWMSLSLKHYLCLGVLFMGFDPRSRIAMSKGMDTYKHLDILCQIPSRTPTSHGMACPLYLWQLWQTIGWLPTQEPLFSLFPVDKALVFADVPASCGTKSGLV